MFVQTTPSAPDFGTLRIAIADAAADAPVLAALFARVLALLGALLGRLEILFADWQAGTLPAPAAPCPRTVRQDTPWRSVAKPRHIQMPRKRATRNRAPPIAPAPAPAPGPIIAPGLMPTISCRRGVRPTLPAIRLFDFLAPAPGAEMGLFRYDSKTIGPPPRLWRNAWRYRDCGPKQSSTPHTNHPND